MKTIYRVKLQNIIFFTGLILFTACGGGGASSTDTASVDAAVTTSTTTEEGTTSTTADVTGTTIVSTTTTEESSTSTTTDGTTGTSETETIDTKTRALHIITEYAQTNGGSAVPVAQTYAYAGVVGVGADNVSEFNAVVAGQAASEVDTTEELQTLLDALGASAEPVVPIGPVELRPGIEIPDSLFPTTIPGIPTVPMIPVLPSPTSIPTIPLIPGIPGIPGS